MTFPKELKDAISKLPESEKDKLIFRLLKKDLMLANRLLFELVNDDSAEDLRAETQHNLGFRIDIVTRNYYSPNYLAAEVRILSGMIAEHVSITKDKYGDAWLNLWMLNRILEKNDERLKKEATEAIEKFYPPAISRTFKILITIRKLHEDFGIEFAAELEQLGKLIANNPKHLEVAIKHGLEVNWLLNNDIPDNIADIQKAAKEALKY